MGFLDKNGLQRFFDGLKGIFADKNHTHSAMGAATASAAGAAGFVPAPAAGAQAKFLRGDGTWQTPTNTTYSAMKGATASAAGTAGLVPAPAAGKNTSFLRGDGTWVVPTNTTYGAATASTAGLMSAADKLKMNYTNIAYGTCATAAATADKEIEISGNTSWALQAGAMVVVKFASTNTAANPTFNVNGTGAKSVWYNTAVITTSSLGYAGTANRPMIFAYDGTQYVFISWSVDANTTYSNASLGQGYGTCATAEATAAKVVTLSSYALTTGGVVSVKFTYAVPASATLNINSKGAKAIYYKGAAITAGVIKAGDTATFIYNGSQYHLISFDRDTNTTYSAATTSAAGLMSAADKTKLDGIATGATKVTASSTTPKAAGTAAVGSEAAYARGDHVHPVQTTVSGNAGTATKWATARNINGLLVQGDANRVSYGTCSTAAATAAKTVACTGFALVTGAEITVKFTVTNTAADPTLNVNSTGAKAIYYRGAAVAAGLLAANRTYTLRYNGTQYEIVGDIGCLPTTGGTLTGVVTMNFAGSTATGEKCFRVKTDNINCFFGVGSGGINHGVYSDTLGKWIVYGDATNVYLRGNADTATKLATARTINGVAFNGTAATANYGACSTAAATVEKTVACTGFTLVTGAEITVKFTVTNTAASPTLNVNSTGAKAIYYRGAAITAGHLAANRTYMFRYNGTQYDLVGDINTNTTYAAMTAATSSAAGKAGLVPAPAAGAQGKFLRGDATWVALDTITTYTHSRSTAGVNNFTGSGANGKAKLTANIQAGDTFQINGTAVTAYVGGDDAASALSGEALSGKWVTFIWDGTQVNFKIGGSLSKTKLQLATAGATHVLAGMTFYAGDKTLKTGTMPNLSSNSTITYTSSNGTKVIVGDAVFMSTNSDGTNRFQIRYAGSNGYITSNTLFAYPASDLGNAAASHVLSGKTFTSTAGLKATGTIATKAAESKTITPSGSAQSYTFATSGKYCSGNMTVSVPGVKVNGGWGMRSFCEASGLSTNTRTVGAPDGAGTYAWTVCSVNWYGNENSPMYFSFMGKTYERKSGNGQCYSFSGVNSFSSSTAYTYAMYGGCLYFYYIRLY